MKRIARIIAIVLLVCGTFFSCIEKEKHVYIRLMNTSDKDVVIQTIVLPYRNKPPRLPDSIFHYLCSQDVYYVHAESFIDIECPEKNWEVFFRNTGDFQINVMDGVSFNQCYNYPCDTIRKYVPLMQMYRLILDDIQLLNWIIPYPPSTRMRGMVVWPQPAMQE